MGSVRAGGTPSKGTPKDKRLKENKSGAKITVLNGANTTALSIRQQSESVAACDSVPAAE